MTVLLGLAMLSLLLLSGWYERQRTKDRERADRLTAQLIESFRVQAVSADRGAREVFSQAVTTVQQMTWMVSQVVSPPQPSSSEQTSLADQLDRLQMPGPKSGPWMEFRHPEEEREAAESAGASPVMGWTLDPRRVVEDVLEGQAQPPEEPRNEWATGPLVGSAYDPNP